MDKGWLELESDPGLFTLLIEDFGVQGVQVEEIYDLQKPIEGPVYGFIFLFKWIEERRARRKIISEDESFVMDENVVNNMFFAQQVIPNSCATHALVSVLLNCEENLHLGETFTKLKDFTSGMNPDVKGFAIGNVAELASAHNSHARPEPRGKREKKELLATVRKLDAFHFVSYVPIKGRLFELDGLKPYPIDHGPWGENEDWTEKFRRVISERLGMATGGEPYHDIRFNLMAVVPDRCHLYDQKLATLKTNRQIVLEALQQMVKVTGSELVGATGGVGITPPSLVTSRGVRGSRAGGRGADIMTSLPIMFETPRTRQKTRAAAAVHAAAVAAVQAATSNGDLPTDSPVKGEQKNDNLDVHSYAKLQETEEDAEDEEEGVKIEAGGDCEMEEAEEPETQIGVEDGKVNINQLNGDQLKTVKDNTVKIEISVSDDQAGSVTMPTTVAKTDVTKPLIINTKFSSSPGPSSESTDTASEVGSAFNSPVCSTTTSAQSSPNTSTLLTRTPPDPHVGVFYKQQQHLLQQQQQPATTAKTEAVLRADMISNEEKLREIAVASGTPVPPSVGVGGARGVPVFAPGEQVSPNTQAARSKFSSQQGFTPKDLLALLKNVESEIASTEQNLKDEMEKRKKYRVDDCRRTHNYDQFICTFLSMLAEQGLLAGLVEHNSLIKRKSSAAARVGGGLKSAITSKIRKPDKRKPKAKAKRKK